MDRTLAELIAKKQREAFEDVPDARQLVTKQDLQLEIEKVRAKIEKVLNYLAKKPGRFPFTFTPTHSSRLNLVESFFGKMARQCLNKLRVKSKEDLISSLAG